MQIYQTIKFAITNPNAEIINRLAAKKFRDRKYLLSLNYKWPATKPEFYCAFSPM